MLKEKEKKRRKNKHGNPFFMFQNGQLRQVPSDSCFTDSYRDGHGKTRYGIATFKGLWPPPLPSESVNSSSYKLRFSDFVHAFFSSIVFTVLVLLEPSTVKCFYPSLSTSSNALICLTVLPLVTLIVSMAFMCFPNKRHGLGYPSIEHSSNKTNLLLPG
ncbi:protein DMP2-like [Hibiscus syriacus]|uniref:protein DMP2-like n=1 Tax=Hibiscus syriacus TaxID=106335 RepID=UPI0019216784|nr:protein DMP2-like [Hibiscus syriacus]